MVNKLEGGEACDEASKAAVNKLDAVETIQWLDETRYADIAVHSFLENLAGSFQYSRKCLDKVNIYKI